jgi:NAD(P)-dependent dehydrogenase (short-subunit alcohol dehydrogenase family)
MKRKVVIITGAARGIGKVTALQLAANSDRLILCGRDAVALQVVVEEARQAGGEAHAVVGDVRDSETAERLVCKAFDEFGRLDSLVNAAGIAKNVPLLELDLQTWSDLFALHVTGTLLCCQAVAKALVKQGQGGSMVNLSSLAASAAMFTTGAYSSAKAAVSALTRAFAVELAQFEIRVNAVAPGPVATEQLLRTYGPAGYADRGRSIPLNRLAEPHEVAKVIAFLLSDSAHYMTGVVMPVDGGASAVGAYSYDTYKRNAPPQGR